jgi:hypothetical protein
MLEIVCAAGRNELRRRYGGEAICRAPGDLPITVAGICRADTT